ncbi:MAG: amidohydrolase [Bacteroidetes bacterium]|nr:amidohydrolase [Bacteroidota bacterium]HET6245404.1 amidohydrolase [Bacteroidia bacterium]
MPEELKISLVQTDLHWENPEKNLLMLSELIAMDKANVDLIVLPEMFNTGFTMKSALFAEEMNGNTMQWMRNTANEKNCVITGSLIIKENENYYNRLIWMQPNGDFHSYDKRHLFRMAGENDNFTAGRERLIVHLKGWKICPLICYDLRFPVWSRNKNDYDLLIYIANWPEKRSYAWKNLLIARGIENIAYVAAVNRVGADDSEMMYSGDSSILDFTGNYIASSIPYKTEVITIELSFEELEVFRQNFPAHLDADEFEIKL